MRSFFKLYARAFAHPRRAMEALCEEPKRLLFAFFAVAITSVSYALVYFFLAHNGGRPTVFKPWLAIPAEVYYRYNFYFIVPSIALAWVSAAGFAHLTARACGGKGAYEDTLAMLGLGLSISTWWTGLHDVVTTFLGFLGVIDQRAYEDAMSGPTPFRTMLWTLMLGYLVWFLVTFSQAISVSHRLPIRVAAIAGTFGVVVYQLVFVIFNR